MTFCRPPGEGHCKDPCGRAAETEGQSRPRVGRDMSVSLNPSGMSPSSVLTDQPPKFTRSFDRFYFYYPFIHQLFERLTANAFFLNNSSNTHFHGAVLLWLFQWFQQ